MADRHNSPRKAPPVNLTDAPGLGDPFPQGKDYKEIKGKLQQRMAEDGGLFVWSPEQMQRGGMPPKPGVCGEVDSLVFAGIRIKNVDGVHVPNLQTWRIVSGDQCVALQAQMAELAANQASAKALLDADERRRQWDQKRPAGRVQRDQEKTYYCSGCADNARAQQASGAPAGRWPWFACMLCGQPESVMKNPLSGFHQLCTACSKQEQVCQQCNCAWE